MDISDNALRLRRDLSHEKHKRFPPEKKIEVVTKWMALGNMRIVAELTGVSYQLCRMWKQQPWWADLVAEIKASRDIQVDNKLSKLVDKSLLLIGDRLENGNIVWNRKLSQIENIPISISEATKVADTLLTQQLNLSKKKVVESHVDQQKTIQDQIKNLAIEFARFNTRRTVDVVANEVKSNAVETGTTQSSWESNVLDIDSAGTTGLHAGSESKGLSEEGWDPEEGISLDEYSGEEGLESPLEGSDSESENQASFTAMGG